MLMICAWAAWDNCSRKSWTRCRRGHMATAKLRCLLYCTANDAVRHGEQHEHAEADKLFGSCPSSTAGFWGSVSGMSSTLPLMLLWKYTCACIQMHLYYQHVRLGVRIRMCVWAMCTCTVLTSRQTKLVVLAKVCHPYGWFIEFVKFIYIYIYVYNLYTCVYEDLYICAHIFTCKYIIHVNDAYVHVYMRIYSIHMHIHICVYVCMYTHTYLGTCKCST
jgi:hypothetical protein